jgi:hypothetical protein
MLYVCRWHQNQMNFPLCFLPKHRHSPDYPVGRSRLEALSVIACAFIMSMASVEGELLWVTSLCECCECSQNDAFFATPMI